MSRRKKTVIANWKMNPESLAEALKIVKGIKKVAARTKQVQTIICPPFIYLGDIRKQYRQTGSQDVSMEIKGAHTGEVSARMLKKNGADYVILGHSERRAMGETDEIVNKKVQVALNEKLKIILCIGESKRDEEGEYLNFVKAQLKNSLKQVSRKYLKNILVTYEPVFAIGGKDSQAVSPHEIHQMIIFIRKHLIEHFSDRAAERVPILYGGSVGPLNAREIVEKGEADGLLVGHQSLNPEQFSQIIRSIK